MRYSDVLHEAQAQYGHAINDIGLSLSQAFAFAHDEMYVCLSAEDKAVRSAAFTATFFVAIEGGMHFEMNDPLTREVVEKLISVYSDMELFRLEKSCNAEEQLMLEHAKIISNYLCLKC